MTRRMRMFALALLAVAGAPAQAGWFSPKDKVVESFLKPETVDEASLSPLTISTAPSRGPARKRVFNWSAAARNGDIKCRQTPLTSS